METNPYHAVMELIREQDREIDMPQSLYEASGRIGVHLTAFNRELARTSDHDADRLVQSLTLIAACAVNAAADILARCTEPDHDGKEIQ
jgi:hypothetical protein